MNVIDIAPYRTAKILKTLEDKIATLCTNDNVGNVRRIKNCFTEWLKISNSR